MSYLSLLPAFERLPYRVVMVCTGNICRSAMAQIVLAQRLRELGVSEVEVSSAGVSNEEQGNPIDYRAARLLREQGYKGFRSIENKGVVPSYIKKQLND